MSAGSEAYPTWAIRPGATRSNAKGERVLVGSRLDDGRVDVWVWRLGGWHRRKPQLPERILKAYPTEGEAGLPVPTVSPSPAWVPAEPERPVAVMLRTAIDALRDVPVEVLRAAVADLTAEERDRLDVVRLHLAAVLEAKP